VASDDKKPPTAKDLANRQQQMLERLRSLSPKPGERSSDSDMWAQTTVEPLPPADHLIPEESRPTIKQIPREIQQQLRARVEQQAKEGVTSKLERVTVTESTPEPLPPQPEMEQAAQSWFDSVPTSPSPSIGPFGQITGVGGDTPLTPEQARQSTGDALALTRAGARSRGHRVGASAHPPWARPALIAATALAVGMVIGALVFGADDPAVVDGDAGICECREAPLDAGAK
jgi:hypothetical protein